eukprot:CAMPEP_0175107578 /NCGR_PEP_ID=MMETSP0086_2-20121207/12012_1 /TAXON_ID=136419 /ORGANISM="Unknown Unknown, Strain D1" /LENGTH=128 /DNA_ID=CAMNT_0016384399 /DNA_START=161 /DNA_END=547 /DNA_ORIENTATION=-
MPEIESMMKKECKKFTILKEKRMCYYIGGSDDAATGMLRELSRPLSYNMPKEKICENLKKKDAAICELAYEKEIDVNTIDLKKARVKELRNILSAWGETCKGCTAKSDFIRRIEELKPKYANKGKKEL